MVQLFAVQKVWKILLFTAFIVESKFCKGFFLQINFPPMRALQFITDHVTFKLHYNQIYQMKTTKTYLSLTPTKNDWSPWHPLTHLAWIKVFKKLHNRFTSYCLALYSQSVLVIVQYAFGWMVFIKNELRIRGDLQLEF